MRQSGGLRRRAGLRACPGELRTRGQQKQPRHCVSEALEQGRIMLWQQAQHRRLAQTALTMRHRLQCGRLATHFLRLILHVKLYPAGALGATHFGPGHSAEAASRRHRMAQARHERRPQDRHNGNPADRTALGFRHDVRVYTDANDQSMCHRPTRPQIALAHCAG